MKYIHADKLIAEIERRKKQDTTMRERNILIDIETAIASLQQEQPEVEFEKEITNYYQRIKGNSLEDAFCTIARHFYELGLNARKEETK